MQTKHLCVLIAGKGLTSWLSFVMFNCVLSLSHVVSWVRCGFVCLFDFILYVPSTIFQLIRDGSSWVEQVLS